MIKNPIERADMFAEAKSMQELEARLTPFNKADKIAVWTILGMANNMHSTMCQELINKITARDAEVVDSLKSLRGSFPAGSDIRAELGLLIRKLDPDGDFDRQED